MIQVQLISYEGVGHNVYLDKNPNVCPFCHHKVVPSLQQGYLTNIEFAEIVFRCSDSECQRIFIGYYSFDPNNRHFTFNNTSIGTPLVREFTQSISEISPTFVEIYNQSMIARVNGLEHISGMGLRKALEFLIKDYLINRQPAITEQVLNKLLGACIKDYVENENIKNMANRAVWLGNDQTHYVARWVEKDISDLQTLIDITLHWIEMELLTKMYNSEMP